MKSFIKETLTGLARNELTWPILKPFSTLGFFLFHARSSFMREKDERKFKDMFSQKLEVQNGPFKGMKYPAVDSVGSNIFPKLVGSYEKELWETVEEFKSNDYTEIIDIGCAEGYYAVGLAMCKPAAKVYAYDISEKARRLCKEMAELNKVADRVMIKSECTAEELGTFPFTGKGLIICDCEGFEKELFNRDNIRNLLNCALLIETHDFIDLSISTYLKGIFRETHDIKVIKSVDDIEKALTYKLPGVEELSFPERKQVMAEERPAIMEWLICRAKV
jgi:hypothetical protein